MPRSVQSEIDELFDEIDTLLKNHEVESDLAGKGVNTSLAMTLAYGLRCYLHGDKKRALLELETATDEIAARMSHSSPPQ